MSSSVVHIREPLDRDALMLAIHNNQSVPGVGRELYERYRQTKWTVSSIQRKLQALSDSLPIQGDLTLDSLPILMNRELREWVVRTYNHLNSAARLDILTKDREILYKPGEEPWACYELTFVVREFISRIPQSQFSFHQVLDAVELLKDRNLIHLHRHVLKEELSGQECSKLADEERIWNAYLRHRNSVELLIREQSQFERGNFGFIKDEKKRSLLKNAFDFIEAAMSWSSFNFTPVARDGKFLHQCNHLRDLMNQMNEREERSLGEMIFVMRNMHELNRVGWEQYVFSLWSKINEDHCVR